jgi:hypothetical protein
MPPRAHSSCHYRPTSFDFLVIIGVQAEPSPAEDAKHVARDITVLGRNPVTMLANILAKTDKRLVRPESVQVCISQAECYDNISVQSFGHHIHQTLPGLEFWPSYGFSYPKRTTKVEATARFLRPRAHLDVC